MRMVQCLRARLIWLVVVSAVLGPAISLHAVQVDAGAAAGPVDPLTAPPFVAFDISADADDGTEVNSSVWHAEGYPGSTCNRMGAVAGEAYDTGLRFHLPSVTAGETFVYARLVLPASGAGQVDSGVMLRIVGADHDGPLGFDVAPPSQLPKTTASVDWDLAANWPDPALDSTCTPLYRYSPDISPIINEIIGRPTWGHGMGGKVLALVIEDRGSAETNFVAIHDYRNLSGSCPGTVVKPTLELYRTLRATFVGKELLGCPTDHSVIVNAFALLTLEVYFEFGTAPGEFDRQTVADTFVGGSPLEVMLDQLSADTRYYYRMRYRRPGQPEYAAGPQRVFHTQRSPGGTFTFSVQSDSHLQDSFWWALDERSRPLYRRTLRNALQDKPDFHIDLGDTFHCEFYVGRDVLDYEEAVQRHLEQRPFLDLICHSAPFFFALGNHEGEQGWRLDGSPDNVAVWATTARKSIYPLPSPDDFYTGSVAEEAFVGLRENYYAWEWGDALFVVLDPYWYTTIKPHGGGGTPGSDDNWDWTFGVDQYDWLRTTLQNSTATFKFVFSHHVTGGVSTYGRGGIEAASHALGGRGSFEWGGEDLSGADVFTLMRPGWGQPVHDLMVANGVTIFFHGHDHVFVKQELDGVVYQLCPQPSDASYRPGFYMDGQYTHGDKVNNSGHLRVAVSPAQVTVDYIRAYLPGDGPNGEVAYSYTVPAPGQP
ncbi:MAG: metallophosphoesterase [Planctomycetes bacterium]|nr:metallophosphoesterase [Planctomycetota bacterium]